MEISFPCLILLHPEYALIYIYIYLNILYIILVICLHILFFWGHILLPIPKTHARVRARAHTHSLSLSPFFFHFYLVNGKIHCGWKNSSNMFYPNLPCKGFLHLEKMKDRDGTPLIRLHPTPSPSLIFRLHPTSLLSVIFSGLIE